MEPVSALPYSEYAVVNEFNRHFGKQDGFSIYVPASRQEKGVDFGVAAVKDGRSFINAAAK